MEGMDIVENSNKNPQVLSCLALWKRENQQDDVGSWQQVGVQ